MMGKKGGLFGAEEFEPPEFDEKAFQRAMDTFREENPPTPKGKNEDRPMTTDKILAEFNGIFKGICTDKQLHDALIEEGYRYEYIGSSFFWLIGEGPEKA